MYQRYRIQPVYILVHISVGRWCYCGSIPFCSPHLQIRAIALLIILVYVPEIQNTASLRFSSWFCGQMVLLWIYSILQVTFAKYKCTTLILLVLFNYISACTRDTDYSQATFQFMFPLVDGVIVDFFHFASHICKIELQLF